MHPFIRRHGLCIIIVLAFVAIMLNTVIIIVNSMSMGEPSHNRFDDVWAGRFEAMSAQIHTLDSIDRSAPGVLDSAIVRLRATQMMIIDQQSELVNDLRQETNNNINKINQWLTYAVGLLAIIGVFVPLVFQFQLKSEASAQIQRLDTEWEKRIGAIESLSDQLTAKVDTAVAELKAQATDTQQKLEAKLKKTIGEQLKRQRAEFSVLQGDARSLKSQTEHSIALLKYQLHITSLVLGFDERTLTAVQLERNQMLRTLWNSTIKALEEISDLYLAPETNNPMRREALIECFLHIYSFARTMKANSTSTRNRDWDHLVDDIRQLLYTLNSAGQCRATWQDIRRHTTSILHAMQSLAPTHF